MRVHASVFVAIFCNFVVAFEEKKGGYTRPYQVQSGNLVTFPAEEDGTCYIRMSYSAALAANSSGLLKIVPGSHKENQDLITVIDCCEGYNRNDATGKCETHCVEQCVGGRCMGGKCVCEDGWVFEKGECKPSCQFPCQLNAYCFAPNVCECKLGYVDVGGGVCRPICPGGCSPNGECVSPRVCRCKPGYIFNKYKECTPVCEGGCNQGTCVAPGVCSCNPGYVNPREDRESCIPVCPNGCYNGICSRDGVCTCKPGFTKDSVGRCALVNSLCWDGCPNGLCVGPNDCICNPGFIMNPKSQTCIPARNNDPYVTDSGVSENLQRPQSLCEGGCRNGRCVGFNECVCNTGYIFNPRINDCVPSSDPWSTTPSYQVEQRPSQCPGGCINGRCDRMNECVCDPGYIKNLKTRECIPAFGRAGDSRNIYTTTPSSTLYPNLGNLQCPFGCLNGRCGEYNQCICNPSYTIDPISRVCVPVNQRDGSYQQSLRCQNTCINGQCDRLNRCTCYPGYFFSSRTQSCLPAQALPNDSQENINLGPGGPLYQQYQCRNSCENGICVAPGQCVCNPGYVMNARTQSCVSFSNNDELMVPEILLNPNMVYYVSLQCRDGCPDGRCVGPDQCMCNPGFAVHRYIKKCVPLVSTSFGSGGQSILPSRALTRNNSFVTRQDCRRECLDGFCIEPNLCVCNPGYSVNPITRTCSRNRSDDFGQQGNENGVIGVIGLSGTSCDPPCINGECTSQNICSCNRGYTNDIREPNKCLPVCYGGCQDGICSAPNFCICNRGFVKDRSVKGVQRCIPEQ